MAGAGSPLAPPMRVTPADGGFVGRCDLGIAHEGPPGYGHGGVSAMLLDELMGEACTAAGNPGHDHLHLLVEADGIFVVPDPDLARALFPSLNHTR